MKYGGYSRRCMWRGVHMWSEKEREFAQWFEACGHHDWIYEPDVDPEGYYVPDFFLPKLLLRLYIEIKPGEYPVHGHHHKWEDFCLSTHSALLLYCGSTISHSEWLFLPVKDGSALHYKQVNDYWLFQATDGDQAFTALKDMITDPGWYGNWAWKSTKGPA